MTRAPKLTDELVRKFAVRLRWHPDDLHRIAGRDPMTETYSGVRNARAVATYAGTKHATEIWPEVHYSTGRDGRELWARMQF